MDLLLISYVSTLGLLVCDNIIWLFLLALTCYYQRKCEVWAGAGLAILVFFNVIVHLDCQAIVCNQSYCYLSNLPFTQQNPKLSNTPDQYPLAFSGKVNIEPISSIVPICRFTMDELDSIENPTLVTKRSLYTDSLSEGLKYKNYLDRLFLYGGWAHFFCFSGWHANALFNICFKNKLIFAATSLATSFYLNFSFPFLRSAIEKLLGSASYSLFMTLLILPYAPMTTSFWLTLYYQHLIKSCHTNPLIFLLTNLCFSQLFMGKINLLIFIFFQLIGEKFVGYVIAFFILSQILSTLFNQSLGEIDYFLNNMAEHIINYANIYIEIPNIACWLILIILVFNLKFSKV